MKKITILAAALLGSVYFANAQVGIGTPTPNASAMLDITATDKGVLIPRVALTDASTPLAEADTHENSLLVYNTATAEKGVEGKEVTPGFYYWFNGSWERVTSQTDLENIIGETNQELENIINLLQTAYPSNNLDGSTSSGSALGGGMVYTPASGTQGEAGYVPAKIEYVYYTPGQGTPGEEGYVAGVYVKQDLSDVLADIIDPANGSVFYNNIGTETAPEFVFQYWDGDSYETITLSDLVQANETKTKIQTIEGKQFYFAENFEGDIPTNIPDELPAGMYLIDVVGGVVNNFSEIINSNTTIGTTNQTIKQYFEELGATDSNTVYFNNSSTAITVGNVSVPAYTFYLKDASGNAIEIDLADLIAKLEAVTTLVKSNGTPADPITYTYSNEDVINGVQGATPTVIEITADMVTSITNNTDVQNAISNVLNQGGNVYYGDINGTNVFYTIDANGNKIAITIPVDIDQLITTINNTSVEKKNELKLALGDKITTNNTSVFTGNTITIDNVVHYIYKGNFTTTVTANSANTSGVTLDKAAAKILSLDLRYSGGMVANITDMTLNDEALAFKIGTGKMYQVLDTDNITADVVIEFASTVVPAGVNP